MALSDNQQFSGSFQGVSSYIPLVGVLLNKFENFSNLTQVKYNSATQVVAGDPVIVKNRIGTTIDNVAIESMNAICGEITDVASTIPNLSGFILQSPQDIVPIQGGEAYPVAGFLSYVALLGSGAELYLPCDYTLNGCNMASRVTWDFNNACLTLAVHGTEVPIPARIKSGVVNGKRLVYSDSPKTATWTDCKAILVELNNITETKEST